MINVASMHARPAGPERPRDRLFSARLVGREQELGLLVGAAGRPPAVVLVEGEAGVGKSRLVEELRGQLAGGGRPVRVGHCHSPWAPFLLEPVVQGLRRVAPALRGARLGPTTGCLRRLMPELGDVLPPAPEPLGPPSAETHQVFRALGEVLGALGPTVLVLEDLHWADPATLDFLHFLATEFPPELTLVLTYREEDLAESSRLRSLASRLPRHLAQAAVRLAPLDPEQVADLAAAILDLPRVAPELARHLHARTGGLPFAVEEVLQLLRDRQELVRPGVAWSPRELDRLEVPGAVRDAVVERLGRLSPDARRLVVAAAVLGRPAGEETLGAVAGTEPEAVPEALSEALRHGLLREAGAATFGFRHDLARQAVYDPIPTPERSRLHLRAGAVLAADPACPAAHVAHQFREAGCLEAWAPHAERAAEQALQGLDDTGACRILAELVTRAPVAPAERARLAVRLGWAALASGTHRDAIPLLAELLEAGDLQPGVRGELRWCLAHALLRTADVAGGVAQLRLCLPELSHDPAQAALAMMSLADLELGRDHFGTALAWMDRAVAEVGRSDNPSTRQVVMGSRASLLLYVGDPAGWEAVEAEWGAPAAAGQDPRYRSRWLVDVAKRALLTGHYRQADEVLAAAARGSREVGDPRLAHCPVRQAIEVLLDWYLGRWEGLETRAEALLEDRDSTLHHPLLASLALHLCLLAAEGPERARPGLAEAVALAPERLLFSVKAPAAAGLARACLEAEGPQAAVDAALPAVETLRRSGTWGWGTDLVPVAVEALLAAGEASAAEALAEEFARGMAGRLVPTGEASLALCRGAMAQARGRLEDAAAAFQAAAVSWASLGRPYDAALASERSGRALIDVDRAAATARLLDALELGPLGAAHDAARVRGFLRERDVPLPYPWRGGRRRLAGGLSAREQEIMALAAEGHSMRDIAQRLYLSPRTVESHLFRARRKQRGNRHGKGRGAG